MNHALSLFDYLFIDNKAPHTLFLLHGTGGDKEDFLFLDDYLDKQYNLVGLRGNVKEGEMNRFFRRLAMGVFDQENIRLEAEKLSQFIFAWTEAHSLSSESYVFLGYSNGANMLLATLFYYPDVFKRMVLLHPMLPFVPDVGADYSFVEILLTQGERDQMISESQREEVMRILHERGARLQVQTYSGGHDISRDELHDVVSYLR